MSEKLTSNVLKTIVLIAFGALLTIITGLLIGGITEPFVLADPGAFVRFSQPITKLILNLSMAVTVGSLVLSAVAANSEERARLQPVASWAASTWLAAAAAYFVLTYLVVSGSEVSYGQGFSEGLWFFATEIELGSLLAINLLFALVLSLSTLAFRGRIMGAVNAALSLAALYPLAESGTRHQMPVTRWL